jgi:hypothetical protein
MRVRAGRTLRSLLLSHAEPDDPGCSGAAHGPALQSWRPASILANRGNKDFVCLARKALAICIEAAKTGIRRGRGRARGSRRPSFAMIAFRTGWSRWSRRSRWSRLAPHPLWSGRTLKSGLALRPGRTRWPRRSLGPGRTLGTCDALWACWPLWTGRTWRSSTTGKDHESNEQAEDAHSGTSLYGSVLLQRASLQSLQRRADGLNLHCMRSQLDQPRRIAAPRRSNRVIGRAHDQPLRTTQ